MDELDERILSILKKNSRTPFVEIADKIGLTEGAVRSRVNRLIREGAIKKFTIEAKGEIKAIVLVTTSTNVPTTVVADKIRELSIGNVYEVSGNYEIICFVQSDLISKVDSLVERIRRIRGVMNTSTCLVLK
jgi:DNA-binding Lrp family transcriptional regulator